MKHPLNLTFGVELEFLCVYPNNLFRAFVADSEELAQAGNAIYLALYRQGIPVTGFQTDAELELPQAPSYTRWRVEKDELHLSPNELAAKPKDYACESIELSSRKFYLHHEDWRAEIAKVLSILDSIEGLGCRMIANASSGFHVHVGNDTNFLSLSTVKNVYKLGTAFERCFDLLHTIPRIACPEPDADWGAPHRPPSYFHLNRGHLKLSERLVDIDAAATYVDVGKLFPDGMLNHAANGHVSAYNFDNMIADSDLGRYPDTITKTIEFRQHTGTLSFADIEAWVMTVTSLVTIAHTDDFTMSSFLAARSEDLDFGILDLLCTIGLPHDIVTYYGCKLNAERDPAAHEKAMKLVAELERPDYQTFYGLMEAVEVEKYAARNAVAIRDAVQAKLDAGLYGI